MSLVTGARLGPFEILSPLGAGGMGEVYRARDTTLNRDVAIKVLLAAVASDPDRLQRFSREAQLLASLNHPNIAQVHGIQEEGGVRALVMELVEGPTLAERIALGPIPLADALPIAKQIAEALEGAHEQGIIHRDLKPANIKVRPDGTVKVLDFGLAKALDPAAGVGANVSNSPTLSMHATQAGLILGTAAYMSPEQASGRAVDRRSDLWAFGVVLIEMLTGRHVFEGETVSHVLAAVLTKDPDWTALPANTPAPIRKLLRRCLEKDRKKRLSDAAVARLEIDDALTAPATDAAAAAVSWGPARTGSHRMSSFAAVALFAAMASGLAVWLWTRSSAPPSSPLTRFAMTLPSVEALAPSLNDRDLAFSPDGKHLVYTAGSERQLAIRFLDRIDPVTLAGISHARAPFLSPDGRWVGFFEQLDEGLNNSTPRESSLRKVPIAGGQPLVICKVMGGSRGATWGSDDSIVFATSDPSTGLLRVSARGGDLTVLTKPDRAKGEEDHFFPSALPGARGVLFTIAGQRFTDRRVAVLDLKSGQSKVLVGNGGQAEYLESGHLAYVVDGSLWAVRFDLNNLEVVGEAVPVMERAMSRNFASFSVSRYGGLAYVPAIDDTERSLVWVDRGGRQQPIGAPSRRYRLARLSPDGTRLAIGTLESVAEDGEYIIWTLDLAQRVLTRLTFDPTPSYNPVWDSDGGQIFFQSGPLGAPSLVRRRADGTGSAERLVSGGSQLRPTSISPDGKRLIFEQPNAGTAYDLMMLQMDGSKRVEPLIQTTFDERDGEVSPDGRWIAYDSNESGRNEIYVRPFPNVKDGQYQISTGGGRTPAWARRGHELFFVNASSLFSVPVQLAPTFRAGQPAKLFDASSLLLDGRYLPSGSSLRTYDVSGDDQRFLMMNTAASASNDRQVPDIVIVQNWFEELKAKVPAK